MVKGGGDAGGGVRVGGEGDEGNPWWMCEKERDQLIGKIDCEGERERKKGSVYVCVCVLRSNTSVCCGFCGCEEGWEGEGAEGWEGNRIGLVCGTHGEDNGTGGGGASVTRFCFVARSTGVCHGCRLASPRLLSDSGEGPAAMRTGAPGPLMRGVLFLIKDGQAIITIIIRSCTMEHASLSNGWENPPTELRR